MTAPCKDCPDRRAHCHSYCEKYKEFKKTLRRFKGTGTFRTIAYNNRNQSQDTNQRTSPQKTAQR